MSKTKLPVTRLEEKKGNLKVYDRLRTRLKKINA